MIHVCYNGYSITGRAKEDSGGWRPRAEVSWFNNSRLETIELTTDRVFATEKETETYAIKLAKRWVHEAANGDENPPRRP